MANTEMLLELKTWVRQEWEKKQAGLPSEWEQSFWVTRTDCGTACCIAGKAAFMAGWEVPNIWKVWDRESRVMKDGRVRRVESVAEHVLDLTEEEADALFWSTNSIEDIEEIIDSIVDGTFDFDAWDGERS